MKIINPLLFVLIFFSSNFFNAQTKIIGIKAKLFYNENKAVDNSVVGRFSENIIDNNEFTLWNTIIGEGSSEGYSNQTLVIVELSSNSISNKKQEIRLTASTGKNIVFQQVKSIFSVNDPTLYNVIFVLDETGCDDLTIKADILSNNKIVSTFNKKILFECGE